MKKCNTCGETKPLSAFGKNLSCPDGKMRRCRVCHNVNARRYLQEKPHIVRGCERRWRQRNPDKVIENRKKNRPAQASRVRAWWAAHPEKRRAYEAQRRAAKRLVAWADKQMIEAVYAYAKHLEAIVGRCQVDHIVPLQGDLACGLHTHHNLRVITDTANKRKHNKVSGDEAAVTPAYLELGFLDFIKARKQ